MFSELSKIALGHARTIARYLPAAPLATLDRMGFKLERKKDCQINIWNFEQLKAEPPQRFSVIRFDPNMDCNLRCVYCHNARSKALVDVEDFRSFIETNVISVDHFQVGCVMEPTLDGRLADLMLMVAGSPAKPKKGFMLQTNGILLHRHDAAKMREAGLTELSVSLDAAQPETQKSLRSGTSLDKVLRNVSNFRETCPKVPVTFMTTVTTENIESLANIVELGLEIGVKHFVFREIFYVRDNAIVDHARMPALCLADGEFARAKQELLARFGRKIRLTFADEQFLKDGTEKTIVDSKYA